MKIYIACALTHVPREMFTDYVNFIHELAKAVREVSGVQDVKYALVNSDPQLASKPFSDRAKLCYLWDRDMVEEADLVIAEASFPSTGLGIELQIAENAGIPVIMCFRDYNGNRVSTVEYETPDHSIHLLQVGEGYVSLMALGMPAVFSVIKYHDEMQGLNKVVEAVELVRR